MGFYSSLVSWMSGLDQIKNTSIDYPVEYRSKILIDQVSSLQLHELATQSLGKLKNISEEKRDVRDFL